VRVPNAALGYEWMAFATAGKGHDLLGQQKVHNSTLVGLLQAMGEVR